YGVVVMDEAHYARKAGHTQVVCAELSKRARVTLGMTATPIVTSPMDIVLLGRILQVPGFDDDRMEDFRKAYNRAKAEGLRNRNERKETVGLAAAVATGQRTQAADNSPAKKAMAEWVNHIRELLKNHVIRRTTQSTDLHGKPIHRLDPIYTQRLLLELRPDEMEVQMALAEGLKDTGASVGQTGLEVCFLYIYCGLCARCARRPSASSSAFYLGIRRALLHKNMPGIPGHVFPSNASRLPYSKFPSTKIDALVKVLKYYEGKSCAPPPTWINGDLGPPDNPEGWPVIPNAPVDKILVYLAFPSSNWIVRKALKENNIGLEEINSGLTVGQRAATLERFRKGTKQVLLLSNVGTVGLNIAFASVVCIDNLWSAQEKEQLLGRVWRHPQEKRVAEIDFLASGTSDIFIESISDDKGRMHQALMGMNTSLHT
ncbi:P-loop containing nucleoside triphosphate hydrolase protein, partial [Lenzites betulinus]